MALGARRIEAEVPNCTKPTRIEADSGYLYIIYMYKSTYISLYTYTCTHVHVHVNVYIYIYTCRYIDMDIGIYIYNHILQKNKLFYVCFIWLHSTYWPFFHTGS